MEQFIVGVDGNSIFNENIRRNINGKITLKQEADRTLSSLTHSDVVCHLITSGKELTSKSIVGKYHRLLLEKILRKYGLTFSTYQYCTEDFISRDKFLACSKLDVDVMIETDANTALKLAKSGIEVLFFDIDHNAEIEHENITKVFSWSEIYQIIEEKRKLKKETPKFVHLGKEERMVLSSDEQIEYIKSYKKHIKNLYINRQTFETGNKRFKLLYYITLLPFSLFFKSKISGLENMPCQDGFIIASNHLNSYDQFYITRALKDRQFVGFAADSIRHTIRGRMFNYTGGAVFIDRSNAESRASGEEEIAKLVAHGKIALIFPEGTRKNKTEEGKKLLQLPFKLGTVSIAQKTCTGILPISLYHGEYSYMKIGEMQFVGKGDNLIEANTKLEQTIASMTLASIQEDEFVKKKR